MTRRIPRHRNVFPRPAQNLIASGPNVLNVLTGKLVLQKHVCAGGARLPKALGVRHGNERQDDAQHLLGLTPRVALEKESEVWTPVLSVVDHGAIKAEWVYEDSALRALTQISKGLGIGFSK